LSPARSSSKPVEVVDGKGKGEVQAKEEQAAESVAVVWWRWQRRRGGKEKG